MQAFHILAVLVLLAIINPLEAQEASQNLRGRDQEEELDAVTDTLSLPQYSSNPAARSSDLNLMFKAIANGPRYRQIAATGAVFQISRGPQLNNPLYVAMTIAEVADITARYETAKLAKLYSILLGGVPTVTLDDLANMYKLFVPADLPYPLGLKDWQLDSSFAADRLTMQGFRLKAVSRTDDLPFLIDETVITMTGYDAPTLRTKGRLFKIDFSDAGHYSSASGGNYVPSCLAYFYISDAQVFLPLAIHLYESALTYTPLDAADHWTFAKIAFSAAESNWQQMHHFRVSHLIIEPIRVETMRYLSKEHPIHALLQHHFKNTFAFSYIGFQQLWQQDTSFDVVFGWGADGASKYLQDYRTLRWSDIDISASFKANGVNKIPGYKFRDDFLALRNLVRSFVLTFLKAYYKCDNDLKNDGEVQGWMSAIRSETGAGVVDFAPSDDDDAPGSIDLDDVVNVVSTLIVDVGVFHHAMNSYAVWNTDALPAKPRGLWAPLPTNKTGPIDLRGFLPSFPVIVKSILLSAAFNRYLNPNESLLNSYDFVDLGSQSKYAIKNFQKKARDLSRAIQARENCSTRPYTMLDPVNLPYFGWV